MRLSARLSGVAGSILLAIAIAGCGDLPGAPAPKPPAPSSLASSLPDPPDRPVQSGQPVPPETYPPAPKPICEGGPFGCRTYTSVSGRDATGELEWLQSQPLEVSAVFVNETWTVGVKTPCNSLGVEVAVEGSQLIPHNIIATAMACLGPESGYEAWTHELFKQPVTWELAGDSLVLRNNHGTVELTDSGPNPHV
jgi:hypothetical protein